MSSPSADGRRRCPSLRRPPKETVVSSQVQAWNTGQTDPDRAISPPRKVSVGKPWVCEVLCASLEGDPALSYSTLSPQGLGVRFLGMALCDSRDRRCVRQAASALSLSFRCKFVQTLSTKERSRLPRFYFFLLSSAATAPTMTETGSPAVGPVPDRLTFAAPHTVKL